MNVTPSLGFLRPARLYLLSAFQIAGFAAHLLPPSTVLNVHACASCLNGYSQGSYMLTNASPAAPNLSAEHERTGRRDSRYASRGRRFEFKLSPGQVPLEMSCLLTLRPTKGIFVTPRLRETARART